ALAHVPVLGVEPRRPCRSLKAPVLGILQLRTRATRAASSPKKALRIGSHAGGGVAGLAETASVGSTSCKLSCACPAQTLPDEIPLHSQPASAKAEPIRLSQAIAKENRPYHSCRDRRCWICRFGQRDRTATARLECARA